MILFDDDPTATLAAAPEHGFTAEHAKARSQVIGASEVAALFGLSPYSTRFELWHRKAGNLAEVDLSDVDRVQAGLFLEPAIAAWVAHKTGRTLHKVPGHIRHPSVRGMGCSPDYMFDATDEDPRGSGICQIKNVDALIFAKWDRGESGAVEPPMNYQLQVQHEIACTGVEWGALACLVGGNRLEIFEYARHEGVIARIESAVAEFWASVERGEEPEPDFARDLATIRDLYSTTTAGEVLDLSSQARVPELCAIYQQAGAEAKAISDRRDAAKAELLTLIGPAEKVFAGDYTISAKVVKGGPVSYVRDDYRGFRVSETATAKRSKSKTN